MKKYYATIFVVMMMFLTGCETTSQFRGGNYINQDIMINDALAADAHKIMLEVFPPARVKLALSDVKGQEQIDVFVHALIERLRKSGYAVSDTLSQSKPSNYGSYDEVRVEELPADVILFSYIVDRILDDTNIRVTLAIGDDILTRGYSELNGQIKPLGVWTRLHNGGV